MKQFVLGLVGKSGSGKSTIAAYLKTKGFYKIELSKYLRQEAQKRNLQVTKHALQDIGNELRALHSPDILTRWAQEEIKASKARYSVVDGIRNISEVEYLKKNKQFYLIGVIADSKVRYKRIIKEKGIQWVGPYNNFLTIEKRDSSLGNKKTGLRVSECLKMTDYQIVNNNNNIEMLKDETNKIINNITYNT